LRNVVLSGIALVLFVALGIVWVSRGSVREGTILFQAKVNGVFQLFTIDANGRDLRQLTRLEIRNGSIPGAEQPAWSPDGKTILFDTDYRATREHEVELFAVEADGTGLREVPVRLGRFVSAPSYSPDGTQIAFDWDASTDPVHEQGIDIAHTDGRGVRRLTSLDGPVVADQRSSWSPDGRSIVFTELDGPGQSTIVEVDVDGTGRTEFTPRELNANNAKWSPDGSRIVFNGNNDLEPGEDANLYTVKADGTGLAQLTHYAGGKLDAYAGGWSPDGKEIVFHVRGADPEGPGLNQLFVMNADGSDIRQLTRLRQGMDPGFASWRPG
jgi:Tol biopolymer transport system component